jgi:hypothetical protein
VRRSLSTHNSPAHAALVSSELPALLELCLVVLCWAPAAALLGLHRQVLQHNMVTRAHALSPMRCQRPTASWRSLVSATTAEHLHQHSAVVVARPFRLTLRDRRGDLVPAALAPEVAGRDTDLISTCIATAQAHTHVAAHCEDPHLLAMQPSCCIGGWLPLLLSCWPTNWH